ncbi:MAG: TolC family protein [Candidatus Zhuqueibacterota bacterium]
MINRKELALIWMTIILTAIPIFAQQSEPPLLTLEQCLSIALENNPRLLASHSSVQESEARVDEMRAGFYPMLDFNASASRSFYEIKTGSSGSTTLDNMRAGIYAHYPIFQGFQTVASTKAAQAGYQASQAQYRSDEAELALNVTEAYYRLLQAERLATVAEKSLERAHMHLSYANARFETGLASRSDILKAKVEHSNAELALIRARNVHLAAAGQLNGLLGRKAYHLIRIVDNLDSDVSGIHRDSLLVRPVVQRLVEMAYQSRPELRKMEQQVKAQRSAIRVAKSDYFPSLALDGNYTYSGDATSNLQGSTYIGLSLSFPLFSGFARPARVAQENWALHGIEQQHLALQLQISIEVWNAYLAVKEAAERIGNSKIFYENALENSSIAEGEYREGVGSMLDVIDAQTALVTAEQSAIEALADYKIALANLNRTTGFNWKND